MIENINIDLLRLSEHILLHRKGLRDYVTLDLCKNVVLNYKKYEVQENGRIKFWGIDETFVNL